MRPQATDSESERDPAEIPVVSGELFEEAVLGSSKPVVVDFFATWCGPCSWIMPTLRTIAGTPEVDVQVVKVDVDEAPELAERFRIGSVPTIVVFRDGAEVDRSVGVEPARVEAMARGAAGSDRVEPGGPPGR